MRPRLTEFARTLRHQATEAEKVLWRQLQFKQTGYKFRRQHPIKPYIVDFCCPELKLIIEVDGGQHNENAYDDRRTAYLEKQGYTVLRYWNNEVLENIEGVMETIHQVLPHTSESLPPYAPPPTGGKGGIEFSNEEDST